MSNENHKSFSACNNNTINNVQNCLKFNKIVYLYIVRLIIKILEMRILRKKKHKRIKERKKELISDMKK